MIQSIGFNDLTLVTGLDSLYIGAVWPLDQNEVEAVLGKMRMEMVLLVNNWFKKLLVAFLVLLVGACSSVETEPDYPTGTTGGGSNDPYDRARKAGGGGVFGPDGVTILGIGPKKGGPTGGGSGIGVNSFLWRAALDTVAFMPLASADPFGGVIITDWWTPQESPEERFKVTIYILDARLRADGIKVAIFRQQRVSASDWADTFVAPETVVEMENAVLTKARQIRMKSANLEEN